MDHFSSIESLGEWRSVIYGGIVILTSLLLIKSALFSWRLPPGPRQLPFIGNVLQISSGSEWLQYNRWAKLYGPIFSLSAFGDRVVVLNSQAVANDVLEKNAKLYASRPRLILASDLIGWRNAVALNPGGQQHATYRKIMTKALNTAAIRKHRPLQEQYSETLIRNILATPADFYDHIRSAVGMQLATIVYGMYPTVHGKEYVAFAEEVHEVFAQTAKSYASIIDFVPIARYVPSWVPGFSFMKKVPEWRKDLFELMQVPFDAYKASFARGEAPPSYVADSLSATGASTIRSATEADVKWTAVGLYTGGVDTTVAGVTASILMLLLHPEVQKKAQQEIDELLGGVGVRLPVFDDLPKLKYIPAIVKEILRYWTLAPIGLPHRADSSGVYDGYDIPKDTTIVANIWGIMHDENVYQDAFSFKPERFLSKSDGGLEEPDPTATVFGYGRRICPGQHLAEATLNIYLTRIVSLLSIDPLKDANGNMVLPNEADLKGPDIISIPKRFQCDISPRSASAAALIAQ